MCHQEGHQAGADNCASVLDKPQDGIRTIYGYKDPLNNHFNATIRVFGQAFHSAEQSYQHTKAINAQRPDLAADILNTTNAGQVKQVSHNIAYNPAWEQRKEEVMQTILTAKTEQVQAFRDELLDSEDTVLAGAATGDYFWGTGLSVDQTKRTRKNKWPGTNRMGKLLWKIRLELIETPKSGSHQKATSMQSTALGKKNRKTTAGPKTRSVSQRDISQKELTDFERYNEQEASDSSDYTYG